MSMTVLALVGVRYGNKVLSLHEYDLQKLKYVSIK
jgi:hypothetical protein